MTTTAKTTLTQRLDALYEFDRQPVTADKLQPGRYFAAVFSGEHIAATEFVIGALFASLGATVYDVLVGLVIGNLAAVLSWTLVCAPIAVQTRLTLYWYLRKIAGPAVTLIYNVLNAALFCILAGAMITVSASAIRIPFGIKAQTGWLPDDPRFVLLVLAVGVAVVSLATLGFRRLAQFASLCSPWMVVMFVAGAILMVCRLTPRVHSWQTFSMMAEKWVWPGPLEGQPRLGFWHVAAFAWICNLATHLGLSDMALFRYARRASYGLYSAFGMFLGHYLAWICAGIMGAATVAAINAEHLAGGSRGGVRRPGDPMVRAGDRVTPKAIRDAKLHRGEGPTLAPRREGSGFRFQGSDRAATPRPEPRTLNPEPSPIPRPPSSDPLRPVPGSANADAARPIADDDDEPQPALDDVELVELSDIDSGEIAYQSLGLCGAILVVLAGWTTANPTLYRAGLAFQAVTPGWPRWLVTVAAGGLTTLVACSPFVFRQLLDFVAIYGILLAPVGAIVVAEHWLFPRLGLVQFWSTRRGQWLNWPALVSWLVGLAIAAAAWISKAVYGHEIIHEFFLAIPVWIATTACYIVLAAFAGARQGAGDGGRGTGDGGRGTGDAVRESRVTPSPPHPLTPSSLAPRSAIRLAFGRMALACLAMCLCYPYCVYIHALKADQAKSQLVLVTAGYFVAAMVWAGLRKKGRGARDEGRGTSSKHGAA